MALYYYSTGPRLVATPCRLSYCGERFLKAEVMRLLHRLGFALWLGLLALSVSGTAQTQLSLNVFNATLTDSHADGEHTMPDGIYMAGPMHDRGSDQQGHTHKGHADCSLCGVVASMAAIAVPVLDAILVPETFRVPAPPIPAQAFHAKAARAPTPSAPLPI